MKRLDAPPAQAPAHKYASTLLHDEPSVRVVAFRLEPGQQVPPHHSPSTVMVTVIAGAGRFSGDGQVELLGAGESAVYAPGESHAIQAVDQALTFLAVITPRPL